MKLPFFIARRYLFSKKSHNIINIISAISMFTVAVVTAAMVIVVSAFDGLEKTITDLYKSFDADIVLTTTQGKFFYPDSSFAKKLKTTGIVDQIGYSLEESVLIRNGDKQAIATVKGVSTNYPKISGIDTMLVDGDYYLGTDSLAASVLGYGIAQRLQIKLGLYAPISIYSAKRKIKTSLDPSDAFSTRSLYVAGVFTVRNQPEYDDKYAIVPLYFVQDLLGREGAVSSVELKLKPETDVVKARSIIQEAVGEGYLVKNRYQLHEVLYKVINSEKWVLFLILSLILLVAIFNIMGSLTMLIVEKYNDSQTLKALGADRGMLHSIFRIEGVMIAFLGTFIGISVGLGLCLLQINSGFILMAGEGSMPYPIHIKPWDITLIFIIVMAVGSLVGWLTTRRAITV